MWQRREKPETGPEPLHSSRRFGWICVGALMLVLFGYGLWEAVPDRAAVRLEKEGAQALREADYNSATTDLAAVLRREPRSMQARFGLACVYYLTGHRSRATLELTLAMRDGLPLGVLNDCGHNLRFDRIFLTAKLGISEAFAVPLVHGGHRYEAMLTSEPELTNDDEAARLLVGSCLSFRAASDGAGWYYAANAFDLVPIGGGPERLFLNCLGTATVRRLHCAGKAPVRCLLSSRTRQSYLEDRPHLYRP
jgi:hypothetical protein